MTNEFNRGQLFSVQFIFGYQTYRVTVFLAEKHFLKNILLLEMYWRTNLNCNYGSIGKRKRKKEKKRKEKRKTRIEKH